MNGHVNPGSRRLDVLFFVRAMKRNGAERQLSLLARALHARGWKVAIAVFYTGEVLEEELRRQGVAILDLRKSGRWSNLGMLLRLVALVREYRPAVLHSYLPTQNVVALFLRRVFAWYGCRVVCGIRVASLDAREYGIATVLVDRLQRRLIRKADGVISNSSRALRELAPYLDPGKAHSIPNGIECGQFLFSPEARNRQRAAWGVSDDVVLIGLVGRLDPQKNHALLIEAMRVMGEDAGEIRLVFVGSGTPGFENELRKRSQDAGVASRISWAGSSSDMAAVYSALDILCVCSVAEGFPNVLAEGMCAGLPCVTTDVGDASEVVGDCGWVVPSGDAAALAGSLLAARAALGNWDRDRPRNRIATRFGVDSLASRTIDVLAPIMGGRSR